jgi:hypothetical protein
VRLCSQNALFSLFTLEVHTVQNTSDLELLTPRDRDEIICSCLLNIACPCAAIVSAL